MKKSMLGLVLGVVVLGFVGIGFLGGSSLFYGETIKDTESIDQVTFNVVKNSDLAVAAATVYLESGSSNKKLEKNDKVILNQQELTPEFYNGMSVGYRYVGEVDAAAKYDLEVRRKSQVITKSILSEEFSLVIPEVIDSNQPLELIVLGDSGKVLKTYVEISSLNNESVFKTDKYKHKTKSLDSTEADGKLILNKEQFANLSSSKVELMFSKSFKQSDGVFTLFHKKIVTIAPK